LSSGRDPSTFPSTRSANFAAADSSSSQIASTNPSASDRLHHQQAVNSHHVGESQFVSVSEFYYDASTRQDQRKAAAASARLINTSYSSTKDKQPEAKRIMIASQLNKSIPKSLSRGHRQAEAKAERIMSKKSKSAD
jgi:beta-galactosidase/beta-glucuronidase